MKNVLLPLILIIIIFSCDDAQINNVNTEFVNGIPLKNGHLIFSTEQEYIDKLDELEKMNPDQLQRWENTSVAFNSINAAIINGIEIDKEYYEFPVGHRLLLNTQGIVQVGNEIVQYSKGNKYYLSVSKYQSSNKNQLIRKQGEKRAQYSNEIIAPKSNSEARIGIGVNGGLDARWQREFCYMGNCGSYRKYVHELYSFYETFWTSTSYCPNPVGISDARFTLYLRIKLEYKGNNSGQWKLAGESRDIQYNISYSANLIDLAIPCIPYGSTNMAFGNAAFSTTRNSSLSVQLFQYRGVIETARTNYATRWSVELSGWIYQKITNESVPSNAWTNEGYPLW